MNTIRAGQIRTLNPMTDLPATDRGEAALFLVSSNPKPSHMPDDISYRPGPCRIVYGMLVMPDIENACEGDLILPPTVTGLAHPVYVITDSYTTIWLPADCDGDRFGPVLGNINESTLTSNPDVTKGTLTPQRGDNLWKTRGDMISNLNRLMGWW